ncbi:MAG: excinuclease ABC subunit UvrA [Betaproteobacteria bacterium]|nr:excinuclease ABC subunit UvrA [Betaproteobacteria bacterium]
MKQEQPPGAAIAIRGARQNNLKNLSLEIPTGELVVVTGVSGSGKSSLVFDTLYAEGQRRYVETFSPYARQFLDRMDKPQVDAVDGIPPAIAIDQTNPVRTSRSTVGTMTELNDHLKLLYARAATLCCRGCGRPVVRDAPPSILADLQRRATAAGDPRLIVTFPVPVPANFSDTEVTQLLERQGYTRIHARSKTLLEVVQDRFRMSNVEQSRVLDALDAAMKVGRGRVNVYVEHEGSAPSTWRYSADLHCADCDLHYAEPTPAAFSFNSAIGACETCRGFGRVIGVDFGLVVPDESKTLREGAVKPWQTKSFRECQDDLEKYARKRGIPLDLPWREMDAAQRHWVLEGEPEWVSWKKSWPGTWYGVRRFFLWLESKAYKMHIRVLLSKYRAYTPCATCGGTRLKPDATLWRLGDAEGPSIHDLMLLPADQCRRFFEGFRPSGTLDEATTLLLAEIRTRLGYLCEVGLGYLTLDRQSRTLSGGEVQRINLTTALGTSLVNTLFVLDEPSIGLHPRDMGRVIQVMQKLRDAGNSLVVVEHDPQIMFAADRILDMGPGPGERGGEIVFFGPPEALRRSTTLTADYLSGHKHAVLGIPPRPVLDTTPKLRLYGAAEHNLKDIDVEFPLERLVCVTGVSGSGKSTLVQEVLYSALAKAKGKATESPGAHRELRGAALVEDAVLVDQTPIGKTTRSNPASYVGAWDAIRVLFARSPLARERGYTAGTFSFNAGNGRCPACGGNGFEHVEMQFLSDVYLRCPECDGRRYRPEVLEVSIAGRGSGGRRAERSVAATLEMTVREAIDFFAEDKDVLARLKPLADVGLEYLRLGQPVPTLSGGEAQRLKLAGHLAQATARMRPRAAGDARPAGKLFIFDEPTTGLHFDDVAKLLAAFRKLLAAGHSLLVIEHNLDVVRSADWIVDLGPEGGEAGGSVVCVGTPDQLIAHEASHTGRALKEYVAAIGKGWQTGSALSTASPSSQRGGRAGEPVASTDLVSNPLVQEASPGRYLGNAIRVHHAREHNLKNIDVEIPRERFSVITGVSGSGKSTLAFDILFAEGQRRYLESLNAYARQFVQPQARPDVDAIFGIPPTVAIEQRTSRGGRKSTVGTLTEVHHFLRLLYVKLGVQHCPDCRMPIEPQSEDAIAARLMTDYRGQRIGLLAPLVVNRKGVYTDLAKWAAGKGYTHLRVDGAFLPVAPFPRIDRFKEHTIELPVADLKVTPGNERALRESLARALELGKGMVHVLADLDALMRAAAQGRKNRVERVELMLHEASFSTLRACPSCGRSFPELDPRLFSYNSKHGWCSACYGTGLALDRVEWNDERARTGTEDHVLDSWIEWLEVEEHCPACEGQRLNPEALAVHWRGRSIAELSAQPIARLDALLQGLRLDGREQDIGRDLVTELKSRLGFLSDVGLAYLTLDRAAPTLSGGEAQRIRLAAQLGSNLRGVCYILDEPTIGLHPRDNRILLDVLQRLEAKGNTLIVVEHDEETIRRASHVIDLGPGAGRLGGRVIAQGTAADLTASPESVTGRFLAAPLRHPLQARRAVSANSTALRVEGATLHNLKRADARIPLARLVAVTGVSGSGKSTLARNVIHDNLQRLLQAQRRPKRDTAPAGCRALKGWQAIERVLEVDQSPIGKTPRSCPATYVGFWDAIRKLFADTTDARIRGWSASRFSFNTAGGRCEVCAGQGMQRIEMSFLPDVKVACEACGGARFNADTLSLRWRERTIGEVLALSVDEAVEFFAAHPSIHHALRLLQDVGLGYLTLGQSSPTLSGGEAQRIKLVTELAKVRVDAPAGNGAPARARGRVASSARTLYVLDEPTVGLHMADVEKLIRVLHRLVDAGNTVLVIEHNLDVIAEADWILDLGPEGGDAGGRIVAQGSPEDVARAARRSHTGRVLADFLAERSSTA